MNPTDASSLAELMQQAVALHQRGDFSAAEDSYQRVLQHQPQHFDALHLSGVLARQRGQPERAIELIGQALQIDAQQAIAHCNFGAALQDIDQPERALQHYERALQLKPDYVLAMNNHGNALRKLARFEDALRSYEAALRHKPDYAQAHYNRGTVLHKLMRFEAAKDCFEQALRYQPNYPDAWCNHGLALQILERFEEALISYERALQQAPQHAASHCNRGSVLRKLSHYEEALRSLDAALKISPMLADAHLFRANTLRALLRSDEAVAAYRRALECGADALQVHYALAALGAESAPAASPADYVKNLFDRYAESFDHHLLDVLHYRTPELLLAALDSHTAAAGTGNNGIPWDTVDLGCGTGLCGPLLRPFSHTLTGVDLSPRMLEKARQRGVYDQLECADIVQFLQLQTDRYSLAVAADVLVYIGDLKPLFHALRGALRNGGVCAFSVEEHCGAEFVLRASHRYAHGADYLKKLAAQCDFVIEKLERQVLRYDEGAAINGFLVVMTCSK